MKRTIITFLFMVGLTLSSFVSAEEIVSPSQTGSAQTLLEMLEKNSAQPQIEEIKAVEAKQEDIPAVGDQATATPLVDQARDATFPWLKNLLSLAVVLSSILALAFLYNKKQSGSFLKANTKSLKIIQNISLGFKRSLYVVEFESEKLLIGATPTSLEILHKADLVVKEKVIQTASSYQVQQASQVLAANTKVADIIKENPASVLTAPLPLAVQESVAALDKIPEPLSSRIRDKMFNLKPIKGSPVFKEDLFEKSLRKFSKEESKPESISQAIRGNNLNTLM